MHGWTIAGGKTEYEAVEFEGKAKSAKLQSVVAAGRRCGTAVPVNRQPYECTLDRRTPLEGSG